MPLYDYKCSNCQKVTEVRHGFGESYTDPCPHCCCILSRVFNPAPIVFKGSGFYVNDSRGKSQAPAKDAPVKDSPSKDDPKPAAKDTPAKETPAKDPAA